MKEIFYQNVYHKVNLYNEPITRNFQGFKLKAINITILQRVTIFLAEIENFELATKLWFYKNLYDRKKHNRNL